MAKGSVSNRCGGRKAGVLTKFDMTDISSQYASQDENNELGRHATMAEILAQVSHEALQGDTLDAVLQGIVDCIVRRLPISVASIILLNESCTHFLREVWSGDVVLEWPFAVDDWPVTKGVAGRCVRTGKAQLVTDTNADPDYVSGNNEVIAEYMVPIQHRGRMHAVLNLESTRNDFFTPDVCTVFDAIAAQIAGAINAARLVDELEQVNRKLRELSMVDGLTGIANRRCFDQRLAEEMRRHARTGQPLALLLVDVDHFKRLNDGKGHLHGDECLRELAQLCKAGVRTGGDVVARYGGEELALLLLNCALADAERIAEKLRAEVQAKGMLHPDSPVQNCVTVSIGVTAACPDDSMTPEAMIAAADAAMYKAKELGRNRVMTCEVEHPITRPRQKC